MRYYIYLQGTLDKGRQPLDFIGIEVLRTFITGQSEYLIHIFSRLGLGAPYGKEQK
jgi:hypothetical protein